MDPIVLRRSIEQFLVFSPPQGCLLIIDHDARKLGLVAIEVATEHFWEHVLVGRDLSTALLGVPRTARRRAAIEWARARLGQPSTAPRVCSDTDILFEPTLELDPLRLLQQISRQAGIIATWPGSYVDDVLAYAVPDHGHYRIWRRPEVATVALGDTDDGVRGAASVRG